MSGFRPLLLLIYPLLISCSHDFDSNTLDLGFYQWNFWTDEKAAANGENNSGATFGSVDAQLHPPSCGWDVLHRGNGKLVRIPAIAGDHFAEDYTGVVWFHTRFTLPEVWAGSDITLSFEGVDGHVEIYLNEQLVGTQVRTGDPFSFNLAGIYYTRDNHLCVRITCGDPGRAGVTGKILLKSSPKDGKSPGLPAS